MTPEELKEHLEQIHGIDTTDDSILGDINWEEAHAQDHDEWLGEDAHEHGNPAHERIWFGRDVRLEQEEQ